MDAQHSPAVPAGYHPVQDEFTGLPIRPEVLAAWQDAGAPGWASAVLPLLPDADAFAKTVAGPTVALGRWKARAEREGLVPTNPVQQAA